MFKFHTVELRKVDSPCSRNGKNAYFKGFFDSLCIENRSQ